MELRPEADSIISILPKRASVFFASPPGVVTELVEALADHDIAGWDHHPVNAITTGLLYAANQPESSPHEGSQAFLHYLSDTQPKSLPNDWRKPLLEAAAEAGENYFAAAQQDFDVQDIPAGTINLSRAVNCAIIGQAAIRGWPHADADADINTIVGLASGKLPTSASEFDNIIDAMPDHQLDLNSAYGAATAVLDAACHGYFHTFGYTPESATEVARHAFRLVSRTGEPVP